MASTNLVEGRTIHTSLTGYALDEKSAAEISSEMRRVVGTCRYIGFDFFSFWESCEGTTHEDTRRQLVGFIKYVDARLPQVGKTSGGLHKELRILNPYTVKIVREGLARVRLNSEIMGGDDFAAVGYYDTTSELIEETRKAFLEAMLWQMKRGKGMIFDAITKSSQLYCNTY